VRNGEERGKRRLDDELSGLGRGDSRRRGWPDPTVYVDRRGYKKTASGRSTDGDGAAKRRAMVVGTTRLLLSKKLRGKKAKGQKQAGSVGLLANGGFQV